MLLLNNNLIPLLKKRFGFSDEVINTLRAKYLESVINLIINNTFTFLEQNQLGNDIKKLQELSLQSKKSNSVEEMVKLTEYLYSMPGKYPELAKLINTDILELNSAMNKDFFKMADDETIKEFLEIGAKELEEISHIPD